MTTEIPAPKGVAPAKWARLCDFLGALPPAPQARLFSALEADAGAADDGLPRRAMLAILRTRLVSEVSAFPARPLTARRLFFRPFEDFLISGRRGRKRRARIDRASLAPIWEIVINDAACLAAARAAGELDGAIARGESDLARFENALCRAAADGLAILVNHAEEDATFRADLTSRLSAGGLATGGHSTGGISAGGDRAAAALHDLAEIALLAPFAPLLRDAQQGFDRRGSALTEEDLFSARRLYARAAREAPPAAPYILDAIAARMDQPGRALRLAYHLTRASDGDLAFARADAQTLVASVFDDLEAMARALERDADEDADPDEAPARLAYFSDFARTLIEEARVERDGAVEARTEASRDIAAAALQRYAEAALAAIRRHHPVRHAGGSTKLMALRPDIARPVDPAIEAQARRAAAFLARAVALGEGLARPEAATGIVHDAVNEARRYLGDLVLEIRAAEGAERAAARRRMEASLAVAAQLLPEDEVALFAERANAAAVSA